MDLIDKELESAKRRAKCWLDASLAFFYPECCQVCGLSRAVADEGYVCGRCRDGPDGVRQVEPPLCERCGCPYGGAITTRFECGKCVEQEWFFRKARAAVITTQLILEVIHRYKYRRAMWFEPFLARLLVERASAEFREDPVDLIIPVPLHSVRQREREFNQAEQLAIYLSRATGVPLNSDLVERVECTRTQTMLNRSERADNVRQAFAMRSGRRLRGERVVLVDDVFTTGATTNACAKVLRAGGAGEVRVWTVARGR